MRQPKNSILASYYAPQNGPVCLSQISRAFSLVLYHSIPMRKKKEYSTAILTGAGFNFRSSNTLHLKNQIPPLVASHFFKALAPIDVGGNLVWVVAMNEISNRTESK